MADLLKWVRLVLDPKSAKDTEDGAKKTLGGIDGALEKLKSSVKAIGAAIAAAFTVKALVNFGKAAVDEARQGEKEWAKLGQTIRNVGGDFDGMRESLDASSKAFQDATQYGAGDYLETLDRLITITGDVTASTENMGLVADVAAQFFDGELAPAADLVAKAMNGNVAALGKMGIAAEDAQGALNILAERSFGAAAARAATFNGQLASAEELWKDFLSQVGEAILASEGVAEGFDFVRFALEAMTEWVVKNQDAITDWVTFGIRLAIDAVDVLYRALLGMAQLIRGGLNTSLGIGALAISTLAEGYALALTAASKFLSFIGAKETADGLGGFAEMVKEGAERLREFANTAITAGGDQVQSGLMTLGTRAFTSDQFRSGGSSSTRGARPSVSGGTPRVAAGAKGAEDEELERIEGRTDAIVNAIQQFGIAMTNTRNLSTLLGEDFDALASEASALEGTISELIEAGLEPTDELLIMLRDRYREVTAEMEAMEEATRMEEEALHAQAFAAGVLASALGAAMAGGLGPFAKGKAKQNLLEAAELALRAVAAALTGFGAGKAGAFLGLAAKHTALAGAWGILGASVGGGGGSGTVALGGGGGAGGGGLSPTVARTTSSSSAARAQPVPADVEIHLVGPGFNALNPEVQRVVRGAVQESTERYGNARVRVVRRNT